MPIVDGFQFAQAKHVLCQEPYVERCRKTSGQRLEALCINVLDDKNSVICSSMKIKYL